MLSGVACGLFAVACHSRRSNAALPSIAPMLLTDSDTVWVTRRNGIRVLFVASTLTNRLPQRIYVRRCRQSGLVGIEKRVNASWQRVYEPVCALGDISVLALGPNQSHNDMHRVTIGPFYPRFNVAEMEGEYRAQYGVYTEYETGGRSGRPISKLAPEEWRMTNTFRIVER